MTGRPVRARAGVGLVVLGLLLTAGVDAGSQPAWAAHDEEMPPAVAALDDPATRDAARTELARGSHDDAIVDVLRTSALRSALAPESAEILCDLAAERSLAIANSGLRALLRDADRPLAVRRAAARALAKTGSIADVGALGDALPDLPDECSRALAAIGGDAALGALRRGAGDAPAPEAIAAMARLGDRSGLGTLVPLLADPAQTARIGELLRWATGRDLPADAAAWTDLFARIDLADRLGATDIDAAHAAIRETADAIRSGPRTAADPGARALEERVAALLADEKMTVAARARAALVLGLADVRTRNDLLLRCCANQQPGDLRWAAANALARVGDLSCAVPLAFMLSHDEDRDRLNAKRSPRREYVPVDPEFVRVLSRLGLAGGPVALFDILAGEYRSALQRDSIRALQELSGGETFDFDTDAAAADRKAAVGRMRAWWLDARTSLAWAPRADDPGRPAFRKDVAAQIATLGGFKFLDQMRAKKALAIVAEGAADDLVAALANDAPLVRSGAAEVMQVSALRSFAEPLAARLATEAQPAVRTRLLGALETCARPVKGEPIASAETVRGAVRAALADRVIDVRIAAARTLGVIGDRTRDADVLQRARAEPRNATDDFRAASGGALLLLGDRSATPDVVRQLASDDVAQRAEGLRILRTAGIDTHGFDPDGADDARAEAIRAIRADVPSGGQK